MKVEVGLGEIVDKVTILDIKIALLSPQASALAAHEQGLLTTAWQEAGLPSMSALTEWLPLTQINEALWDVEDALRDHECRGVFDAAFIHLARSVYRLNDQRASLKRSINLRLGSNIVEQKQHPKYAMPGVTRIDDAAT
jgi:hypothetical protein